MILEKKNMAKINLLVGCAGTGKTWVMTEIIRIKKCTEVGAVSLLCYHRSKDSLHIVVGKYDGTTFQGSDRLSMACMVDVPKLIDRFPDACIYLEGDRFMNSRTMSLSGIKIIKILGDGSKGRALRGSNQTDRQLKAISTRVSKVKATIEVADSSLALKQILK